MQQKYCFKQVARSSGDEVTGLAEFRRSVHIQGSCPKKPLNYSTVMLVMSPDLINLSRT